MATKTTALAVGASAVLTFMLAVAAGLTLAASPARAQATGSGCAWATQIGAGGIDGYGADVDAGYWLTSFLATPGAGMQLAGTYPQARYMSIDAYNPAPPGYDAHLNDAEIAPTAGTGVNPFQSPNSSESAGTYTVNIEALGGTAETSGNTLYIPANGQLVTVMYRVYASDDPSDPTGGAGLPQVSTTFFGNVTSTNPGCVAAPASSSPVLPGGLGADELGATQTPTSIEPTWTPESVTHLPDPDTGYLETQVDQTPGQVVVIRATMPTFPDTEAGQPPWWPGQQVRYWSLCEYVNVTLVASDCIPDSQAVLPGTDVGTFVVSTPADRPTNATPADGVNWVPWAGSSVAVIVYRQILAQGSFGEAIADVPAGESPQGTMGAYFPQIVYCSTDVFEVSGADGCFNGAGSSPATGGSGGGHSASVGPSSSHGLSQSEIKSSLGAQIVPTGKAARIRAVLAARGYTFGQYRLPETGSIHLGWFYAHGAHRHKTLVASGQLSLGTRLTGKLHVTLTAAGRRLLAHAAHVRLTGSASFAATGQAAVAAARGFTLRR